MATHETASVTVFPASLQIKDVAPIALSPPANSVQHLACPNSPQTSPAVNILEKAYHAHSISQAKPAGNLLL